MAILARTAAPRFGELFWIGVEAELARLDRRDFALFLSADRWPFRGRASFERGLERSLVALVRDAVVH